MKLEIDPPLLQSLMVMASMVEARDAYTGGHLWRVSQFSKLMAVDLGMDPEVVFRVGIGGFLHDLGKIGVPDAILNKRDRLSDPEYDVIKTHPGIGADLVKEHPLAALVLDHINLHHERPDGRGYPDGLEGDAIPLQARIVGLVDAFDAMTSTRPYRRGMPIEKALDLLEEVKGSQFDTDLTDRLIGLGRKGRLDHIVGHSDEGLPLVACPGCGPILTVKKGQADGCASVCRSCGGGLKLHKSGDTFEAEAVGMASAEELAPTFDLSPIAFEIAHAPKAVSLAS